MRNITQQTDIALALAVMLVIVMLVLPIPPAFLDVTLTLSIALSVTILMVALYIIKPLEFSSFPFVLLIVTLFRLSLSVASTRLILLRGYQGTDAAGKVIEAFGQFIVGGNFVVGLIIFGVLVIINFMVITKGSGRVAEVAARFTLDAMPGKQMSIDADLNAGIIDEKEAKTRREEIRREADFYGSMDGASKFVRGDAIASIIITAINIIGGLIIGVVQYGMPAGDAAKVFTLLTVGDGLVTQIPALIISTSAGIVVTRAGSNEVLSKQLTRQLFPNARVLFIVGGILLVFAIVPGMPKIPFVLLAIIMIGCGYLMVRKDRSKDIDAKGDATDGAEREEAAEPRPEEEEVKDLLEMDTLELEIGFSLIPLVDANQGGTLLNRIKAIRRQIALEMGFIVPPVRIRDNLQLDTNSYNLLLRGVKAATGTVYPDKVMVMNPAGSLDDVEGLKTKEPAFGLPAKWVDESMREIAEMKGYTIVDPATIIATHLTEIIKKNAYDLLGRQETQDLLTKLKERHPQVVDDLVPGIMDVGMVNRVLQNLLREGVSIRNLQTILETLATFGAGQRDVDYLTEKARFALRRQITESLVGQDGVLHIFTIPSQIEQLLAKSLQQTDEGREIVIDPMLAKGILSKLITKCDDVSAMGLTPVLVISPPLRSAMRRFVDKYVSNLAILSHNEISDSVRLESLGSVDISTGEKEKEPVT